MFFGKSKRLQEALNTAESMVNVLTNEIQVANAKMAEQLAKIDEQSIIISQLNEELDRLVNERDKHKTAMEEWRKAHDLVERELTAIQTEVDPAKQNYEAIREDDTEPWASFEIGNIERDGIKVTFNWNAAFIEQIAKMGIPSGSEEEMVQNFFTLIKMAPAATEELPDVEKD